MEKSKKRPGKTETQIEIIKLGTPATNRASGISGVITHASVDMTGALRYFLSPRVINLVTKHPITGFWISQPRLADVQTLSTELVIFPLNVLGTVVTDRISGMKGMAVGLQLHPLGCLHVIIQPTGVTVEGNVVAVYECDYRQLENVPEFPAEKPSPVAVPVSNVC